MANYRPRRRRGGTPPERIARGIGWFSVAMGIAQIVAPRLVTRLVGLPLPPPLTMACGVRELVCGIGILTRERPQPWLQARVAGDVVDLAAFGTALAMPRADRTRLAVATAGILGVTVLDVYCSHALGKDRRRPAPRHLRLSVSVNRPPAEVYRFWRDLTNLPRVMPHLESVRQIDETRSHWMLRTPPGEHAAWDVDVIDEVPGERLAWRSVEGAPVFDAGSVQLAPSQSGGTDMIVDLLYVPAADSFGTAVAELFGFDAGDGPRLDVEAVKRLIDGASPG